jgi:GH25 family lysozyme M1 (1,4-beta-N-acetylmuramidase)
MFIARRRGLRIMRKRRIWLVAMSVAALGLGAVIVGVTLPAVAVDTLPDGGGHAGAGAGVAPGSVTKAQAQATVVASSVLPAGYTVAGIDVSSHDHSTYPIDWTAVAATGVQFAYIKATESTNYTNPYFDADYHAAKAAGILAGAYLYARPDVNGGTTAAAIAQANYFLSKAEWVNDGQTIVPFLDMEWPYSSLNQTTCYGLSTTAMVAWIHAFTDQVKAAIGRPMMIYTNPNWWNPCTGNDTSFNANLLDVASYTSAAPTTMPTGWNVFNIWQYAAGLNTQAGNYDKEVFNGDYAGLTALAGGNPAIGMSFGLKAHANNTYVTAENAGAKPLIANRAAIGLWEEFDLVDAGSGYVALRSRSNGRYVTAEAGGVQPLIANRTAIGTWEKFQLITNDDGSISLQANANGSYVTAEAGGASALIANRTAIGPWEKFDRYQAPQVVSLGSVSLGTYVTAENAGARPLIANRTSVGLWEQFDEVDAGAGTVAFKAHANGRYVSAEAGGVQPLIANRTAIGGWEEFSIVANNDGSVSLLAEANGEYVTAVSGTALIANATSVTDAAKFDLLQ